MVEKLRLKDGTEFDLIPMGITEKSSLRVFKFTSELAHEDILEKFNESNISSIDYVLADDTVGATYKDCVVLKSLTFVPKMQMDDNNVSDVYIITVSIDAIEKMMSELSSGLTYAELALIEVYELLLGVMF